jgi:hypothetical protein
VDGSKIFVDASLVDADASNNSVIDTQSLMVQLRESYKELEARLEEKTESTDASRRDDKKNSRYISRTDPDAAIVNRGKPKLSYQVHRAVDGSSEIITATEHDRSRSRNTRSPADRRPQALPAHTRPWLGKAPTKGSRHIGRRPHTSPALSRHRPPGRNPRTDKRLRKQII